jgi:hypothetical protein
VNDEEGILLFALGAYLLSRLSGAAAAANAALQQGGANVYETLHPSEAAHQHHLPGKSLNRAQLIDLVTQIGFPDPPMAVAIIFAESGGVPNALGDGGLSIGLFQIYTKAWPQFDANRLREPVYNAHAAFKISKGGREWKHWSTYKSGRYQNFLRR